MAHITLRQSNSIPHANATVKGAPLTNDEVDNNFANINISVGNLQNLSTTAKQNVVVAINEVSAAAINPIPFAIALG
jgi:hypothetical protein